MFHCKIYQTKSQLFALKLHVPVRNCAKNSKDILDMSENSEFEEIA